MAGGWSSPVGVKAGKGLVDPCPLADDEGFTEASDEGRTIIEGEALAGWHTIEGLFAAGETEGVGAGRTDFAGFRTGGITAPEFV